MISSDLFNKLSELLTERDKMAVNFAVMFLHGGDIREMYDRMEHNEAQIFAAIKSWSADHRPANTGDGDDNQSTSCCNHR